MRRRVGEGQRLVLGGDPTREAVAIRFLGPSAAISAVVRSAARARSLEHPGLARVIDVLELDEQSVAVVSEWVAGEPLGVHLERVDRLDVRETADSLLPLIDALETAHREGLPHGHVTTEAILRDPLGGTTLLGMGLCGWPARLDRGEPTSPRLCISFSCRRTSHAAHSA